MDEDFLVIWNLRWCIWVFALVSSEMVDFFQRLIIFYRPNEVINEIHEYKVSPMSPRFDLSSISWTNYRRYLFSPGSFIEYYAQMIYDDAAELECRGVCSIRFYFCLRLILRL